MKIPIVSERTDEVRVSFRHALQRNGKDKPFSEATVEWVGRNGKDRVHKGVARVHPNDAPERRIGRKVALARALWDAGFTRDERRQVWMGLMEKGMRV